MGFIFDNDTEEYLYEQKIDFEAKTWKNTLYKLSNAGEDWPNIVG